MISCEAGDIVLVPFPFADLQTTKQRPALVLQVVRAQALPELLLIAMITSRTDSPEIAGDSAIRAWKGAGLLKASKVRLAKLVTVEHTLVRKKLGVLRASDRRAAAGRLRALLAPWIEPAPG